MPTHRLLAPLTGLNGLQDLLGAWAEDREFVPPGILEVPNSLLSVLDLLPERSLLGSGIVELGFGLLDLSPDFVALPARFCYSVLRLVDLGVQGSELPAGLLQLLPIAPVQQLARALNLLVQPLDCRPLSLHVREHGPVFVLWSRSMRKGGVSDVLCWHY